MICPVEVEAKKTEISGAVAMFSTKRIGVSSEVVSGCGKSGGGPVFLGLDPVDVDVPSATEGSS